MTGYEAQAQRLRGMHYVTHDFGQLCLTCATDYDLTGPTTFAREGSCYNCGPDDLESQRKRAPSLVRRRRPTKRYSVQMRHPQGVDDWGPWHVDKRFSTFAEAERRANLMARERPHTQIRVMDRDAKLSKGDR